MRTPNPAIAHYCGVMLVDWRESNPNGSPDEENRCRTDPETGHGIVTDACIKRKIRDWLSSQGHELYIRRGACLEETNEEVATTVGLQDIFASAEEEESEEEAGDEEPKPKKNKGKAGAKKVKATPETSAMIYAALNKKYPDARVFGCLVPRLTGTNRGPLQISVGRSIDPVFPMRRAVTRVAVATRQEAESQGGANRGMGSVWALPYGLYRFHWYLNPVQAAQTGMTEEDLQLILKGMTLMFDNDRSSVRSTGCLRLLYALKRNSKSAGPGSLSDEHLLEMIRVRRIDPQKVPRAFSDYAVDIHPSLLKSQDVTLVKIVDKPPTWDDEIPLTAAE